MEYIGEALFRLKKYKEAIYSFDKAIELYPLSTASHQYKGILKFLFLIKPEQK